MTKLNLPLIIASRQLTLDDKYIVKAIDVLAGACIAAFLIGIVAMALWMKLS